jgi:plastocyanin
MQATSDRLVKILIWIIIIAVLVFCTSPKHRDLEGFTISNAGNITTVQGHVIRVATGGGNISLSLNQFLPKDVEINAGDNITWYNPSKVPEPHTVTFASDSNLSVSDIISPFVVPNSTQFVPLPPDANSEPVMMAGKNGTNVIIGLNTRAVNPIVIDSIGDITYLNPNASYNMDGTEKYLNSGAIFPEGKIRSAYQPISEFTVKFAKAGTYNYLCIFHPWMTGTVVVK